MHSPPEGGPGLVLHWPAGRVANKCQWITGTNDYQPVLCSKQRHLFLVEHKGLTEACDVRLVVCIDHLLDAIRKLDYDTVIPVG